ncbi:MAG: S8 family serine peptidase, partial [Kiritimatiellales bacterium]
MRRYLFLTLTVGLLLFFGLVGYRSLHHTGSAVAEKQETVSVSTPVALPVVVDAAETPAGAVPHRSVVKTSAKQPAEILQVTGSPGSRIQPIDESRIVDQRITDISKDRKKRELLVNAGGKYPVHRIEETLVKNAGAVTWSISARTEMVADHVLVKLQDGQSEDDLRSLLNGYGVSILRALSLPGHYIVSLNAPTLDAVPEALSVFTSESNVLAYAEPDYISHIDAVPNDTRWSDLWGMVKINATGAWDVATGSTNVIVAVIDTGIDLDHPDLISNLWHNAAEVNGTAGVDDDGNGYIDDANGWDFASDDNVPEDSGQHGTHCAGTIGAVGNNTLGVAGVCWTVRLMALRGGTESALYQSDTADAIVYAADNGAKIISASYGGGCYNDTERDAIVYANSKGVLFVAAAGNESLDSDETPNYPSGYDIPNIVAVAATDRQDALASFSNYGKKSVDLAAPGVDILSTVPGGTYASFQGTSMATPHVAGAAALLLSAKPMLTHLQVKEALLSAVDIISSLASKTVSGGRLNLQKLITMQDTDGDGMPDDWEIANGLATNNAADAAFDPDGDHLNNLGEYENRCIITNADTDADSLVDGWEVTYGFNPNSPTGGLALSSSLGSFTTAGSVANVVVEGNYAYLADGGNGLVILNISNSQNPVLVGSVDTAGTAMDVAVSNGYAYVADGANGLVVVAVSNPALPWIEGSYNTAGTAKGIAAQSNWVYLADGTSGKVEVFDVSTPASPQVGTPLVRMMSMNDVFMRGDSAYVAALANVLRLDISNPSAPQAYANSAGFTGQDIIGIHGNASIVAAAAGVFGVKIMNDASIQARTTLGTYDTDGTASGVFVDGNYVYVADGTNGLVVLDITTPSIPVQTVHVATIGSAVGVFVKNGTVYVAEGETGMEIFSILSDSDRDGLLDSWERTWFGDLLRDGTADYDNDGISDWGEYLAGLDPTDDDQDGDGLIDGTQEVQDYNSDPRLADTDGDGLVDGYDGIVSTNTYPSGVDANSNGFVDGELDFGGVTAGARGIILVDSDDDGMNDGWEVRYGFDPRSSSSPGADGDADSDGLTNLEESINNTDPNNPDTDGDGMPDGWEVDNSFDPLVNDSALDADSDGLTNLQEYTLGTDPHNADTDGDTMPDGWEYSYMPPLNPTNSLDGLIDSDGDGLTNRYEYSNGCNPTNTDTDADGMPDGWEVDNGLDPTDSTGIHGAQGDPDSDGLLNIQEYSLSASNLWQAVYTSVTGSVMVFSYTDSATNTVEYIPGATDPLDNDSDNDGLTDYDEITTNGTSNLYITNPNSTDTDADDLPDNWELAQIPVSDPTVAARPTDDSDGDGLTNQEEGDLGTQAANRNDPIFVDDDAPLDPDSTSSDDVGSFGNSDTNENGTINHPFDAIQEAIGSASTGATILVNDGWYNGPGNCEIDLQGKAVTIRSWHGKDVTTISTLGAGSAFLFTHGEITNTVLQGLTIKGALCESSDGDCDWIDILRIEDSSPVIRDCTIQDTGGNAIQCSGDAHPQFFNCLVANARNGFWCEGGAAPIIVSNVIQHIRLYDEVFPLDEYWGNGIYAVQGVGLELRSTTIEDCQGRGMYVQSATEVLLEDSTVRNSWGGIRFAGVDATLLQCKIQGNEAPNYYQVENTVTKRQGLLPDIDGVTDYTYENENGAGILLTDGCAV